MKNDGYISNELSPVEIDAIRQAKASLELNYHSPKGKWIPPSTSTA